MYKNVDNFIQSGVFKSSSDCLEDFSCLLVLPYMWTLARLPAAWKEVLEAQ